MADYWSYVGVHLVMIAILLASAAGAAVSFVALFLATPVGIILRQDLAEWIRNMGREIFGYGGE